MSRARSRTGPLASDDDLDSESPLHNHEKPAAVLAASIMKWRGGRCTVAGASATVGRGVRREFCRVLGLGYRDPVVLRAEDPLASASPPPKAGADDADDFEGEESFDPSTSRLVRIPPTVRHFVVPVDADTGGGQLAAAATITSRVHDPKNPRRVLLVLTK
ncbi:hypothetical protein TeGR_g14360 [Tetraparma gracilis]|uniref:Uncharacterized protein n=1 Tax=Tetraparma gracilis TaxID=2962635 RepID=A0ABQ6MB92_9STRA|nr:hypothetical protein TeGR_g14360 [Tetraparma gracilis]